MPPRPLVTGMLAAAMAATALHVASGPSTPAGAADGAGASMSLQKQGGTEKATKESWAERLDRDPGAAGRATAEEELHSTLCAVIARAKTPCAAAEEGAEPEEATAGEKARPKYTEGDTGGPEVMFAILPDPIHTHLALWFDRSVDALQDALQDEGWEYQRHWIPWRLEGGGTEKAKDREQQELFSDGQEQYPGVILFRPKTGKSVAAQVEDSEQKGWEKKGGERVKTPHPLVVFLIGDSPTSGINETQFKQAVAQFRKIAPEQDWLNVVGPNFTGAGPSLHALLDEEKKAALKEVKVDVASGSVSDWRCEDLLPAGKPNGEDGICTDGAAAPDSFVSFEVDFAWEAQQTERYLEKKGRLRSDQIAQLSEDESGFGALGSESEGESKSKQMKEILRLTFPRNISHLRSAYEKNRVWGFGGSSEGTNSVNLNLDFDETHEADEAVPEFSNKQMPVSQDATLSQVTAILEQRHIKAVLLSATDVLDELFVAKILARQAPNVVVVVRGTDVLFLRSGDGGVYHNMYAVGPWPLIPKNYYWSEREPRMGLRDFPNDHAEGFYTATRYLIEGGKTLRKVQDYSSPITWTQRPPLWLLSIGHGAYWPLALLPKEEESPTGVKRAGMSLPKLTNLAEKEGLTGDDNRPQVTQLLWIIGACLLCLMHMGKCLNWRGLAGIGARYGISEESTRPAKLRLQLGISLLGMLMLCLLCGPEKIPSPREDWSWALPLLIGGVALWVAAARSLLELNQPVTVERPRHLEGTLMCWLAFLGVTALLWWMVWELLPAEGEPAEGLKEFFVYRSRYPLSGASPVLPLLLTVGALIVYLLNHLDRFTFGETMRPRLPSRVTGVPNCPDERMIAPLNGLLVYPPEPPAIRRKLGMLGIITFNSLIVVVTIELTPKMFDGGMLATVCGAAMFAVLLALLWDLAMAAYLWRQLKLLCLEPLESSALRAGFSSMCGIAWKDLWLLPQAHKGLSQYRTLSRALEQSERTALQDEADVTAGVKEPLGRLWELRDEAADLEARCGVLEQKEQRARLAKDWHGAENAQTELHKALAEKAKVQLETIAKFGEVQGGLAVTAQDVLKQLKDSWADEVGLITAVDETREKGKQEAEGGGGVSVANLRTAWREDMHEAFPWAIFKQRDEAKDDHPSAKVVQTIREEWIALIYLHYIRMVLIQIRSRLLTSVTLYLLLVLSVTCYPYLNRHVLILALAVVFAILAATAVTTYASINRDPILSRTTESEPGRLDLDFYMRAASMVGVPLLGLIASQFPEVSSFLFSWIEPGMAAVK